MNKIPKAGEHSSPPAMCGLLSDANWNKLRRVYSFYSPNLTVAHPVIVKHRSGKRCTGLWARDQDFIALTIAIPDDYAHSCFWNSELIFKFHNKTIPHPPARSSVAENNTFGATE